MGCKYDGTDWPEVIPCTFRREVECNGYDYAKCNTWCMCHPEYKRKTLASFQGCTVDEQGRIAKDDVNHPSHYTSKQIEVIDYIKDTLTPEQYQGYLLGNALKYISRAGKKDPIKYTEDLRKCVWYLNREIERVSK